MTGQMPSDQARRAPIVIPVILTAAMVAVTLSLGVWQIQRGAAKKALIAALDERLATAPVALPLHSQWSSLTPERDEFRRVTFQAAFDANTANVFASGSALRSDTTGTGVWVFAPVKTDGGIVVVNRGYVPDADKDRFEALPAPTQPTTLTGYLRFPEKPGVITPRADQTKRLWFIRDTDDMGRALNWGRVAPFYIDLESPIPQSGLPKPGVLTPKLRDEHLQYAMTWFGLAGAISIAFLVWLRSRWKSTLTN
jgi:cytochrome oxidase assembly protein ShyY1